MYIVIKNPFERFTQKGAASALCMCLLLAGSFTSCTNAEGNIEEENLPVYVWTEGQKYYFAFDEKIPLYEVNNKVVFSFDEKRLSDIQQYLHSNPKILHDSINIDNKCCILTTVENANLKAIMEDLKKQAGVLSVNPMYLIYGGTEAIVTGEIIVQFKENISQQEIDKLYKKYRLGVKRNSEHFQLLSVPIDIDTLEVANAIQISGLVNYSHPNFLVKIEFFNL